MFGEYHPGQVTPDVHLRRNVRHATHTTHGTRLGVGIDHASWEFHRPNLLAGGRRCLLRGGDRDRSVRLNGLLACKSSATTATVVSPKGGGVGWGGGTELQVPLRQPQLGLDQARRNKKNIMVVISSLGTFHNFGGGKIIANFHDVPPRVFSVIHPEKKARKKRLTSPLKTPHDPPSRAEVGFHVRSIVGSRRCCNSLPTCSILEESQPSGRGTELVTKTVRTGDSSRMAIAFSLNSP